MLTVVTVLGVWHAATGDSDSTTTLTTLSDGLALIAKGTT
jgi:hypothetical protein